MAEELDAQARAARGQKPWFISAPTGEGLKELAFAVHGALAELPKAEAGA